MTPVIRHLEELEDIRDARAISAAIAAGEETYPHEFVKRLSSDENPLKVWREYRKLTLATLAKACGVSIPALSQIKSRENRGLAGAFRPSGSRPDHHASATSHADIEAIPD
jgi:hypothetical protein